MSRFQISVPSKTFLLGEYAVLKGHAAILLATEPRFKLIAAKNPHSTFDATNIHPESPAGKLLIQDDFYRQYEINFIDPYHGLGGFGASSAQFVMLYALKHNEIKINEMLKEYKKFAWNGEGFPPSGLDLISQVHGSICYYLKNKNRLKLFSWPFPDLGYCLVHTGNKLSTHVHLSKLTNIDTVPLNKIVQTGLLSIEQGNEQAFIDSINQYEYSLRSQNLVIDHTQKIIEKLAHHHEILSCKGCGALGADVIFILYRIKMQEKVLSLIHQMNLNIITYGNQISKGIQIKEINSD